MKIAHATDDSKEFFRSLLPKDPRVTTRPMFGNVSAFVNGNMFFGAYGEDLFVRLPDEDRAQLLREKGACVFEPVKGHQMKEYVLIPRAWRSQNKKMDAWISRSLEWASKLPKK